MTEQTPETPADGVQEPDEQDGGDPVAAARREAAAYRRRLREAEAERDRLSASVISYQRAEAEALAGNGLRGLQSGSDLWDAGVQLADLLDESGRVDPERTQAAVDAVLAERPHWRRSWGDIDQGVRGAPIAAGAEERFRDALRNGGTTAV